MRLLDPFYGRKTKDFFFIDLLEQNPIRFDEIFKVFHVKRSEGLINFILMFQTIVYVSQKKTVAWKPIARKIIKTIKLEYLLELIFIY